MKKIFITGGTGFFGKSILKFFQKNNLYNNFSVTVLTRNISKFKSNCPDSINLDNISFFEGDILDITKFPKNIFDYVIHAATDSTTGLSMEHMDRSNQIVYGTTNILEWCINSNVKRLLYVSSGGIYGPITDPVSEDINTCPSISNIDNTYSISKLFSEHLCFLYAKKYNFSLSVARCFSFVGEDLPTDAHFAIGNFIRNIKNNESITINGDGSPIRSFMDQEDLAKWLIKILLDGKNQIYNVGSDEEISILDLAKLIKEVTKSDININVLHKKIIGQSSKRNYYVPDISKAKKELNLDLDYSLKDSLKKIFEN